MSDNEYPEPRDEAAQDAVKALEAKGWNDCRRAFIAVLAAATPGQEAIAAVIRHAEALCASHNRMHDSWLNGRSPGTSMDWQASSAIRSQLRKALAELKSASVSEQKGDDRG